MREGEIWVAEIYQSTSLVTSPRGRNPAAPHDSNLKKDALNVFISHDNYVYPCCIVGGAVTSAKTKLGYNNNEHIRELLNNISSYGLESFSLANTNLKEILNTGVLHTTYYDDIRNGNASTFCKLSCGKCSDTKKAYNPF